MTPEKTTISEGTITFEVKRTRLKRVFLYKYEIIDQGDHYSVSRKMFIDGEYSNMECVHIPKEIIKFLNK